MFVYWFGLWSWFQYCGGYALWIFTAKHKNTRHEFDCSVFEHIFSGSSHQMTKPDSRLVLQTIFRRLFSSCLLEMEKVDAIGWILGNAVTFLSTLFSTVRNINNTQLCIRLLEIEIYQRLHPKTSLFTFEYAFQNRKNRRRL